MHTIKITPNLLFEYQCTSGKFIRLPNRIETFLVRIGMLYRKPHAAQTDLLLLLLLLLLCDLLSPLTDAQRSPCDDAHGDKVKHQQT